MLGLDSAYGPTPAVARIAAANGVKVWGGYLGGPGAFRAWASAEWQALKSAGIRPLAIWVPSMTLKETPAAAAGLAQARLALEGMEGSICLDTEHVMAALGAARVYGWCRAFFALLAGASLYDGARVTPVPTSALWLPLWGSSQLPGAGQAVQYGPNPTPLYGGAIPAGRVDIDIIDPAFPLAAFTAPAPPPPAPSPAPPGLPALQEDAVIQPLLVQIPVGADGHGWAIFDGGANTDPGSWSHPTAIPWGKQLAFTPYGVDPAHDGTKPIGAISIQERNGFVLIDAQGFPPGDPSTVAYATYVQ